MGYQFNPFTGNLDLVGSGGGGSGGGGYGAELMLNVYMDGGSDPTINGGETYPVFNQVVIDSYSSYSTSNGKWTCPTGKGGLYLCAFFFTLDCAPGDGSTFFADFADCKLHNYTTSNSDRIFLSLLNPFNEGEFWVYSQATVSIADGDSVGVNIYATASGQFRNDSPANTTWKLIKL